jgi:hypothetical protein
MSVEPKNKRTEKGTFAKGTGGPGRKKGVPNKSTTAIKDMVISALDGAGGVQYLIDQASANPSAFMTLVGKVIPLQVTGADGGAVQTVTRIEIVAASGNGTS